MTRFVCRGIYVGGVSQTRVKIAYEVAGCIHRYCGTHRNYGWYTPPYQTGAKATVLISSELNCTPACHQNHEP
jgi:hypothetical protein